MKPAEVKQIEFIKDCLREREQRKNILAKFCKVWQNTKTRTFDRLLKSAKTSLQSEFKKIDEQTDIEVGKEIKKRKIKLMSAIQRKVYLEKIATGKIKIPYTEVKWNPKLNKFETIKFKELAPHTARISAIAELNKMSGDYAPSKSILTLDPVSKVEITRKIIKE